MKTLKENEKFVIEANRSGAQGFSPDEMREYLYTQYSGASLNFVGITAQQTYNDVDYIKINVFNNAKYSKGSVTADVANDQISVSEDGFYRVIAGFSFAFGAAEELSIAAFLNGVQLTDNPSPIRGEGAGKPQIFTWTLELDMKDKDILDLRAFNNLTGNVITTYSAVYLTVERIS